MAVVDPQGRLREVNPALTRLTGRTAGELLAGSLRDMLLGGDEGEDPLAGMGASQASERRRAERRLARPDGTVLVVELRLSAAAATPAHRVVYVLHVIDVTADRQAQDDLRRYDEHLRDLGRRDSLTGLLTRRELHREIDLAVAGEEPFTLVLLSLEPYAERTRMRGEMVGDEVLRTVAVSLGAQEDRQLVAARTGPAEIGILAPGVGGGEALPLAERLADTLETGDPGLLASWGTASHPEAGDTRELVVLRAELALHAARPEGEVHGQQAAATGRQDSVEGLLDLMRRELGFDLCYLTHFEGEHQRFEAISGDQTTFGIEPGDLLALEASYCARMLRGDLSSVVPDAGADPVASRLGVTGDMGIGAWVGVPVRRADGRLFGTLCAISHHPRPELDEAAAAAGLRLGGTLMAERLEHDERESDRRRTEVELSGLHALLAALSARDHYTSEHTRSVVTLAAAVARRLGLEERAVGDVRQVATLHDVGKVGMPDAILQKRGSLGPAELDLMRQHPVVGARILEASSSLKPFAAAVRAEHERWDGRGYPDGLAGSSIPLASRITLACDAYDAMTSDRPYRSAMSRAAARSELRAHAGTQFDPRVVEALLGELEGGERPMETGGAAEGSVLHGRPDTAWRPLTPPGSGASSGEVRAACLVCGAHLAATLSRSNLVGSCPNCGSYEIELVAS